MQIVDCRLQISISISISIFDLKSKIFNLKSN
jgi:hypothetical protein